MMSFSKILSSYALLVMAPTALTCHVKSIAGQEYDFTKTGTYTLFQDSVGLKVQGSMTTCGNGHACDTGVAVGFKNSVVRFTLDTSGAISYTKASELVSLSVEQTTSTGYRVFIKEESTSYININVAQWDSDVYLETSYSLSETFTHDVKGLVSYDASVEVETFTASYTVEERMSLFSCTDCSSIVDM